jgi:hypothetical protein
MPNCENEKCKKWIPIEKFVIDVEFETIEPERRRRRRKHQGKQGSQNSVRSTPMIRQNFIILPLHIS